jgi:hypothetical protein
MTDNSIREYLALEEKYTRVITLVGQGEDLNISDLRRALDDIFNAGRDRGPVIEHPLRPLEYEINDTIVLLESSGMSLRGRRSHTMNLVNAAKEAGKGEAYAQGYADAKRKVLDALDVKGL